MRGIRANEDVQRKTISFHAEGMSLVRSRLSVFGRIRFTLSMRVELSPYT